MLNSEREQRDNNSDNNNNSNSNDNNNDNSPVHYSIITFNIREILRDTIY